MSSIGKLIVAIAVTFPGGGNWKQWKRKPEMENGNGKRKWSKLDANER